MLIDRFGMEDCSLHGLESLAAAIQGAIETAGAAMVAEVSVRRERKHGSRVRWVACHGSIALY